MSPVSLARTNDLIDRLNELVQSNIKPSEFQLRGLKHEAEKLKSASLKDGFAALGIIAGLNGDIGEMERCLNLAVIYSDGESLYLHNYAAALINHANKVPEALETAKKALLKAEQEGNSTVKKGALDLIITACDALGMEEEFIDHAYEWEALFGSPHPLMDSDYVEPNDDRVLEERLDLLDEELKDRPSFVRLNPDDLDHLEQLLKDAGD